MSLHDLNKIVSRAAKALYDNEKFPVGVLAVRAQRAAQAFPTDPTVVAMSNFLTKRASSETFITRSELKGVYNRLYSQNNRFGSLFQDELGGSMESQVKYAQRDPNEGKDFTKEAQERLGDQSMAHALSTVFEKKAYQPYSQSLAKNAARTCLHELNRFATPHKIDVVAGQADLLICQATYNTPKGPTSVLVPVEVREGTALLPTVFLSEVGFVDLAKEALEEHIVKSAGKKFTVDVQRLLQVVAAAKNGTNEMDVIIAKAKAASGAPVSEITNGILHNAESGILGQNVDPAQPNLAQPRLAEADKYAAKLASPKGAAEFMFGARVVENSRRQLANAVATFGFPHAHIVVADADENNIYFAVSMDNQLAVKVPMKVTKNAAVAELPKMLVAAGSIYDFSKSGISAALADQATDVKMMAVASPAYGLKSGELLDEVYAAVVDGNLVKAEDALNVIAQSGDEATYKQALAVYMDGLNGKLTKSASASTKCSMQRKVAYSKHVICGHTNLPVHKVYQDSHGDCQPLYRKHIAEAEGGSFMTAKILGF